jgi:Asp-tRNA(Asn)/Glu-tRNA(Gln) amidotransferase A subunit family amidase
MVRLLENRQLSALELVEAHLQQIERVNPRINAFVEVYAEEARAAARHPQPGPLSGLPVTIKDSFDLAGRATRAGSLLRREEVAVSDSVAAARLKAACAIILGKTSTPEFLMNYETDNHYVGRTNNPWDLDRTAGGSSGGEAAAIAAFCSPGGVGSDGGGSIREPAHFCGIAGLKPTPGRCPAHGHWPPIANPTGFLGVGGPMARSVADVRALFAVLAGHDPRDPYSAPLPVRRATLPARFAVVDFPGAAAECRRAVDDAGAQLRELRIEETQFPHTLLEQAHELWWFFFVVCAAGPIRAMIAGHEAKTHWTGVELMGMVDRPDPSLSEFMSQMAARDILRARLLSWMEECPLLLAPGFGVQAFPHRLRDLFEATRPVSFCNLFGLPSLATPMGLYAGLPAGVQLVGAPYAEEMLLETGVRLEEVRGPHPRPELAGAIG